MPKRTDPTLDFEIPLWERDIFYIAGIDEAGRGAWAGPVMAGAVILPVDRSLCETLKGVRDSKLMTPKEREALFDRVKEISAAWCVAEASQEEIDRMNILAATRLAMQRAIDGLSVRPQHLLIDYVRLHNQPVPQTNIKHGDMLSLSIACASILAKVTRDRRMSTEYEELYPQYGFAAHKGYGTAQHMRALEQFGPCPAHRMTFHPIAKEPALF